MENPGTYKFHGLEGFGVVDSGNGMVRLCLPLPPSANRYWRMARNRIVVSEDAMEYKGLVALLCGQLEPFSGDVSVEFTVYRARKQGDLDNFTKVLLDALRGIVYPDDSSVVEIHSLRADDKLRPRVEFVARRKE